eukprot:scaffold38317_cov58-Phaeocystis_antarctica.AAC.3
MPLLVDPTLQHAHPGIQTMMGEHSPVTASTWTHATRPRDHAAARPCSGPEAALPLSALPPSMR